LINPFETVNTPLILTLFHHEKYLGKFSLGSRLINALHTDDDKKLSNPILKMNEHRASY
jgi:hypothetical protein